MIRNSNLVGAFALALATLLMAAAPASQDHKGAVQRVKVHGKALEGNLEGELADREVSIYLPPAYETARNRRYPVLYLLHGVTQTDQYWTGRGNIVPGVDLPGAMDRDIASGTAREMIVVMPNAMTSYGGSFYSNSVTTGDWESFIADDLVGYIDRHYRTIKDRMSRGLSGHSMGGYGTIRIGMKRPDVFSSLYFMSACCLINPATQEGSGNRDDRLDALVRAAVSNLLLAYAAAWSPNPKNPPQYLDLPTKDGQPDPVVMAKWTANAPLSMIYQYMSSLKQYHGIAGDCGLQDRLLGQNQQLDQVLSDFGIAHTFETYEGTHVSKVQGRLETKVLPFFAKNLAFEPGRK